MMLDMKRTFDEIVLAHADAERAAQILDNPFYQSVSSSFAGTQEYMAMEKLGQLAATGNYDLVVVDTPPTRSALDFLDAPQRLSSFLDGRLLKVLLAPAKVGGRAMGRLRGASAGLFTGSLTKLLGGQLLGDVSMFVSALETMFGGFRERAAATYALMTGPETAFVVVAAPEPDALREAQFFAERLDAEGMHLAGMVLNRVHNPGSPMGAARARAAARTIRAENRYAAAALDVYADRVDQAAYEATLRGDFDAACPGVAIAPVSARATAVVDLAALRSLGAELAAGKAPRARSSTSGQS
jgi:anion-transporting  ArsA/GET3 family ATPase